MCILHCYREKARLWTFSSCFNLSLNLLMVNLNVYINVLQIKYYAIWILCELQTYKWNEGVIITVTLWLRFKQLLQLSLKIVFGVSTWFEPMASALAQQCSTNWAMKTHTLGAGQFVEFIVPVKGMKHMNIMWTADIQMKWRCDHRSCDCNFWGLIAIA